MAGYARLASLMGAHPEVAVVRRFAALNSQNLLYLQAELTGLENELRVVEREDLESGDLERSVYSRDWQTLSESVQTPGCGRQWTLFMEIRKKLKEYNDTILQQSKLARMSHPNTRDFQFLVNWMKNPKMGNVYLLGQDSDIWEQPDLEDLVTLNARVVEDPASRFLTDRLIHWYHHLVGWRFRKPGTAPYVSQTVHYSDAKLLRWTKLLVTVAASLLPILSIVILSRADSLAKRLGIISLFTMMFSLALSLLTGGRAIEIFGATAAYAAVQVVFVGTTTGNIVAQA